MAGLQPGAATMTVLFTDLVGSTAMRSALGDDRADLVRREHDDLLARVIDDHRGVVVKGLGDGIMAVFQAPSEGVAAAVAIQQAITRRNRRADVALAPAHGPQRRRGARRGRRRLRHAGGRGVPPAGQGRRRPDPRVGLREGAGRLP